MKTTVTLFLILPALFFPALPSVAGIDAITRWNDFHRKMSPGQVIRILNRKGIRHRHVNDPAWAFLEFRIGHEKLSLHFKNYLQGGRMRMGLYKLEVQRKYPDRSAAVREYRRVERLFNNRFGRGESGYGQSSRSMIQYITWKGRKVKIGLTRNQNWITETNIWTIRTKTQELGSLNGWDWYTWNRTRAQVIRRLRERKIRHWFKTVRHSRYVYFRHKGYRVALDFSNSDGVMRAIELDRTFPGEEAARNEYNRREKDFIRRFGLPRRGPHTFSQHAGWTGKRTIIYLTRQKRSVEISYRNRK